MKSHFLGKEVRTPETSCLNCGQIMDAVSAVDQDAVPSPGDATICIVCGHLMIYDDNLKMRNPTGEEIKAYAGNPALVDVMTAIAMNNKKKDNGGYND